MSKVMKNRTDNDIKNKWNSMQRTEGREAIAAITAPTQRVARSNVRGQSSSAYQREYESTNWRPRGQVRELVTTTPFQPFLSTNTTPSDFSLQLSDLGIPAVVTDSDNAHTTTAQTGQLNWERKLQF